MWVCRIEGRITKVGGKIRQGGLLTWSCQLLTVWALVFKLREVRQR